MLPSNLKKFFNNLMTIYRQKTIRDDYGGVETQWDKYLWNEPCRIYRFSGPAYTITFQGKEHLVTATLMCSKDVDLIEGDKIEEENSGESYLVIRVNTVQVVKIIHHLECLLARIN